MSQPMLLSRLVQHTSSTARTGIRSASTFIGKSGCVYTQREVLQEREDTRLSVYKAEYVVQMPHFGLDLTTVILDLRTSLLSSSAYRNRSTTYPYVLQPSFPNLVGFACMLTTTKTKISYYMLTTKAPYLDCSNRI